MPEAPGGASSDGAAGQGVGGRSAGALQDAGAAPNLRAAPENPPFE